MRVQCLHLVAGFLHITVTREFLLHVDNGYMRFMFSDKQVEEFRQLYEHCYEQPCSTDEAHQMCLMLLELYDCLKGIAQKQEPEGHSPS